jgi:hypothetical protein
VKRASLHHVLANLDQPGIVSSSGYVAAAAADNRHDSGIVSRTARLDRARPFRWAWDQRILIGYLNLLFGEEGIGKGNLVAWILARITRGELRGSLFGDPSKVAIAGDEDSFDHVWVPRLHVAGANLKLVEYIESGPTGTLDVRADAEALGEFVRDRAVRVVYFDQLLDNLGYVDSWKDKDVRDALAPLRRVVQETNIAALAALHPNKRGGDFRNRVSGTTAFNAMSRSSLYVAPHPFTPERRVAVRPKGNYAAEPPGFEFAIEPVTLEIPPTGKRKRTITIDTSRIVGEAESGVRWVDVLNASADRRRADSKAGLARRLLTELFADGQARRADEVQAELQKQGLADRTISDAANEVGLRERQVGFPAAWWYVPPGGEAPQ